jgi:hypothetical protein
MVRRYADLAPEHLAKAAARIAPIGTKMATAENEERLHNCKPLDLNTTS